MSKTCIYIWHNCDNNIN